MRSSQCHSASEKANNINIKTRNQQNYAYLLGDGITCNVHFIIIPRVHCKSVFPILSLKRIFKWLSPTLMWFNIILNKSFGKWSKLNEPAYQRLNIFCLNKGTWRRPRGTAEFRQVSAGKAPRNENIFHKASTHTWYVIYGDTARSRRFLNVD